MGSKPFYVGSSCPSPEPAGAVYCRADRPGPHAPLFGIAMTGVANLSVCRDARDVTGLNRTPGTDRARIVERSEPVLQPRPNLLGVVVPPLATTLLRDHDGSHGDGGKGAEPDPLPASRLHESVRYRAVVPTVTTQEVGAHDAG